MLITLTADELKNQQTKHRMFLCAKKKKKTLGNLVGIT